MNKTDISGYTGYLIWLLALCTLPLPATETYKFRLYLNDKACNGYSVAEPEKYLSPAAIERRAIQGIPVTESDLPLTPAYLDTLTACGTQIVTRSKWLNTVVVQTPDSTLACKLNELAFVDSVRWVWKGCDTLALPEQPDASRLLNTDRPQDDVYGYASSQIRLHNGEKLHEAGFRGKGMRVAVIDAGFASADRMNAFDSTRIAGTYNFVSPGQTVYDWDDHGTKVLSCLAADLPGILVGTAPEATYWLLKSEDSRTEFPVEEDYWVAAAEYADSVGVNVITSSLGYFTFDNPRLEYGKGALDGHTSLISRGASIAASKGMLLFCSAGNEGSGEWEKITFPGDAPSVVTVGAVNQNRKRSSFSSKGFTADWRIKPDVVALGSGCCVLGTDGNIQYANGTSFATPVLAGLAVCLWQALPGLSNREMVSLLQEAGHQYTHPDVELGYGIPDLYQAYMLHREPDYRPIL